MHEPAEEKLKRTILEQFPRLRESDKFSFSCGPDRPCFNQCCSDVNITLTPFDIIRLKTRLGISSTELLDRYCVIPFTSTQPFPIVFLKMEVDENKACPFVTDQGCRVYSDRPWACRMYPVGVASPAEGAGDRFYFILTEDQCTGHEIPREWTILEWMEDQGVEDYQELGEDYKAITLHPFFQRGGRLNPAQMDMFFMALYDIDRFRRFVGETSFLKKFHIERRIVKKLGKEDVELLRLGFRWIRFFLFGEPALVIRKPPA